MSLVVELKFVPTQFRSYADFPIVTLSGTFEFVNVLDFKAIRSAISIIIAIYL